MANMINWFEIPVKDMARARKFYTALLKKELKHLPGPPEYEMYAFPWSQTEIGGTLVAGNGYVPSQEGSVLYLNAEDGISATVGRVEKAGGKVLVPKMDIGENGFIAFMLDTEGNKVGLHSQKA
jgi:predicted enzyme related to lactoylglutathione lyase